MAFRDKRDARVVDIRCKYFADCFRNQIDYHLTTNNHCMTNSDKIFFKGFGFGVLFTSIFAIFISINL